MDGVQTVSQRRSPSPLLNAKRASPDFNALIKAVEQVEGKSECYFKSSSEAKTYCLSKLRALGVARHGEQFVVISTTLGPPYKMTVPDSKDDPSWVYLKAFYEPATLNILCNMKKATKTIHKQGRVRESYKLQNGMLIKLVHHTCTAIQSKDPCENCKKHKTAHAKCFSGSQFYCLTNKS